MTGEDAEHPKVWFDPVGPKPEPSNAPKFLEPLISQYTVTIPIDTSNGVYTTNIYDKGEAYKLVLTTHSNHIGVFDPQCTNCKSEHMVTLEEGEDPLKEHDHTEEMYLISENSWDIFPNRMTGPVREI